jgi:hypothetical protein
LTAKYEGKLVSDFNLMELFNVPDARGSLTVLQDVLPFDTARVFWITSAAGNTRGGHRHHVTRQALISLSGEVNVYMNDGVHSAFIKLDSPSKCLIVEPEDWHTMTFGENAVLLVFASHRYDGDDYIDAPYSEDMSK